MHLKYISCEHLSHILAVLLDADSQNTLPFKQFGVGKIF